MIEDPLPILLQISVFYLARELTGSMLLSFRAVLKMDGFCSVYGSVQFTGISKLNYGCLNFTVHSLSTRDENTWICEH